MRFMLLTALLCLTTGTVFADDLPENAVITNSSSSLTIYAVNGVSLSHDATQVIDDAAGGRMIRAEAALSIHLNVEGNLCGGKLDDVSMIAQRSDDGTVISLTQKYQTDPFSNVIEACASYSAPRNVTVALKIYGTAFNGQSFERSFLISVNPFGPGETTSARVVVKYDESAGRLVAIIAP